MINFIATSPRTAYRQLGHAYTSHCGAFTSPRNFKNIEYALSVGVSVWASDNDCFVEYNPTRIKNYLPRIAPLADTCAFFTAPDVVQDATATLELWQMWQPIIKSHGLPVAFVLQNGMQNYPIPPCDALFIGGDNEFKYSDYVRNVCTKARQQGVWIHNGRVNTIERLRYSASFCDSFDGTGYIWSENVLRHLPYQIYRQEFLL